MKTPEPRFSLVIFDYDGTLCDTKRVIAASMVRTFEALEEPPPSLEAVNTVIGQGVGLSETFRRLRSRTFDSEADETRWIGTYRRLYTEASEREVRLYEGIEPALRALHAAGVPIAVVTNKGLEIVSRSLRILGISSMVDLVLGDEPGAIHKPDLRLFTERIRPKFSGDHLERVLIVGDTGADLRFARNAGLASCWAAYGYGDPAECVEIGFDESVNAATELEALWFRAP